MEVRRISVLREALDAALMKDFAREPEEDDFFADAVEE
jgi:hypothetical protein